MGEIVELHGQPAPTKDDSEFVTDLARFAEAIVSEADIKRKYRFGDEVWAKLGEDDELVRAIEAEKTRRVRNGASKREKAQQLVVKAPDVLGGIMLDASANPRHRIDSAKELNNFAANGPGATAPASDRIKIIINLGSDTLRFDKSILPNADDVDPFNDVDTGAIAAIAAKKPTESGGGNTL